METLAEFFGLAAVAFGACPRADFPFDGKDCAMVVSMAFDTTDSFGGVTALLPA